MCVTFRVSIDILWVILAIGVSFSYVEPLFLFSLSLLYCYHIGYLVFLLSISWLHLMHELLPIRSYIRFGSDLNQIYGFCVMHRRLVVLMDDR